jgi:hypothetical protein
MLLTFGIGTKNNIPKFEGVGANIGKELSNSIDIINNAISDQIKDTMKVIGDNVLPSLHIIIGLCYPNLFH